MKYFAGPLIFPSSPYDSNNYGNNFPQRVPDAPQPGPQRPHGTQPNQTCESMETD